MLVDTHTHLYLSEFDSDGGGRSAVERALDSGVGRMMFPNVDLATIEPMKRLHDLFPDQTDMAIGLHPTEVNENWEQDLKIIEAEATSNTYNAIGEIGIDLYWDKTFRDEQIEVFSRQCLLANNLKLPIIIHCREGLDEVLEVFKGLDRIPVSVFHSFGGNADDVARIRELCDPYFGINGIVTFKNSKLPEVLPIIGLDRILLETDSPYLAPVPKRGKRNESAFLNYTAAFVADKLGITQGELSEATTRNYFDFLNRR